MVPASTCTQSMLPVEILLADLPHKVEHHKKEKSTSAKGQCHVQVGSNLSSFYSFLF